MGQLKGVIRYFFIVDIMKFSVFICLVVQAALASAYYRPPSGYQVANTYTYQQYQPSASYQPFYYLPRSYSRYHHQPVYSSLYQPASYQPSYNQRISYSSTPVTPIYEHHGYQPVVSSYPALSSYYPAVPSYYPADPSYYPAVSSYYPAVSSYYYPRDGRFSSEFIQAEIEWLNNLFGGSKKILKEAFY